MTIFDTVKTVPENLLPLIQKRKIGARFIYLLSPHRCTLKICPYITLLVVQVDSQQVSIRICKNPIKFCLPHPGRLPCSSLVTIISYLSKSKQHRPWLADGTDIHRILSVDVSISNKNSRTADYKWHSGLCFRDRLACFTLQFLQPYSF
jgi:hypothetical protein